jgi:von Willebrand factor
LCNLINNHRCDIDPSAYIRNCKYDLCSDSNSLFQDEYLCRSMAAYAYDCATIGNTQINWLSDVKFKQACENSNYAQCSNGLVYSDCTLSYMKTCRNLRLFQNKNASNEECVQGCVCPHGLYLNDIDPNHVFCVELNECPCFDDRTQQYYDAQQSISTPCFNWYFQQKMSLNL